MYIVIIFKIIVNKKIYKFRVNYNVQHPATLAISYFKQNAKTKFNYKIL